MELKDIFLGGADKAGATRLLAEWWRGRDAGSGLAAYGHGADYEAFCEAIPGFRESVRDIIDDSGAGGTVRPSETPSSGIGCVVLCSAVHQEPMRARLRESGFRGEIVLPYRNDTEIGALGIFSWRPENDWPEPGQGWTVKSPRPREIKSALLFHPPFAKANSRHKKSMPLGLLYLASAIRKSFPEIRLELYDAHIARDGWEAAKARVDSMQFDLLLCSYWSAQAEPAFLMSDHVMRTKDAIVVHGGVHATLRPEDAMAHCHKVLCGEGERQIVEMLLHLDSGGTLDSFTPDPSMVEGLDGLGLPAWDLLPDVSAYDHPMHVVGGRRFPIAGSRGCPFDCSFCSSPLIWRRRVRWRSPANIVDEMDAVKRSFGVGSFHFWDDNFMLDIRHAQGLCEELLRRGRDYLWCGLSRGSDILKNKAILPLMKKAGCVGVEIGVESFSDQVSKATGKGEFASETEAASMALSAAGIAPLYTHMLFVPGETIDSYAAKEAFMGRLSAGVPSQYRSDSALGQLATPHVGTRFSEEAPELGLVVWRGSSDSFHHRVNFIPGSLLDGTPEKAGGDMPDPLPWLGRIVQAVYDWTEHDMRCFVRASSIIWSSMDGSLSVRELSKAVARGLGLPFERAAALSALAVVGWARQSRVRQSRRSGTPVEKTPHPM